jgi:hypothetical protein
MFVPVIDARREYSFSSATPSLWPMLYANHDEVNEMLAITRMVILARSSGETEIVPDLWYRLDSSSIFISYILSVLFGIGLNIAPP